jgi:hypothetical protein
MIYEDKQAGPAWILVLSSYVVLSCLLGTPAQNGVKPGGI